jgi:hypothetical protein
LEVIEGEGCEEGEKGEEGRKPENDGQLSTFVEAPSSEKN